MTTAGEHSERGARTSRLGKIVDWFVPEQLMRRGGEEERKARLVIWACLLFLAVTLGPVVSVLISGRSRVPAIFMIATIAASGLTLFAIRRGVPLRFLAMALTAFPLCAMTASSYALGGIHVPSAQAMLLIPAYSFFLGGPVHGFVTLLVVSALHVALGIQAMDQPGEAMWRAVGLIAVDGFLYLFVLGFHNVAQRALHALDRKNRELVASNRELSLARDATEAALQAKTRLIATMSHEVRTPMSGVVGVVRLLQATDVTVEQRELMELLVGSSEALPAMVNDILDRARMEAGHMDLSQTHFRPENLLASAAKLMQGTVLDGHVDVRYRVGPDLPEWLCGDQGRVRQILLNLTANAIRFTRQGHVEVRARIVERHDRELRVRFEVEDTGVGLSETQMARVFDAFAQVHERGVEGREINAGTGLGLTICKQLVSLMGGEIGVDSAIGQGSTFWFDVFMRVGQNPSDELELPGAANASANGEPSDPGLDVPLRVLVAEDNAVNRRVAETMLRSLGCIVDVACTGTEAVAAVIENAASYDVVFMDRGMPDMDGVQATAEIRRREPEGVRTTVIALSASGGEDERRSCREAGMDGYLLKPAARSQLAAVLRRHTRWQKKARQSAG